MNFFMKKDNHETAAIDTVIGEDAVFKGEIINKGPLRICGAFEGRIESGSEVFVGEKSKITGNIHGGRVLVSGQVFGNIVATDGLEISKSGRVHGDITADRLLMEEGTTYKGKVKVGAFSEEAAKETSKTEQPKESKTTHIFNLFSSGGEEEKLEIA